MKRLIVSLFVVAGLLISSAYAQEGQKKTLSSPKKTETKVDAKKTTPTPAAKTEAKAKTKGAKPMKGTVVALNKMIGAGNGKVTKDEAIKLADQGQPIVFMSGSKIYFIFNADGTFAGKKLANYANNKAVGIVGKVITLKGGLKGIVADLIESMD
jgi:hypothetical protein